MNFYPFNGPSFLLRIRIKNLDVSNNFVREG